MTPTRREFLVMGAAAAATLPVLATVPTGGPLADAVVFLHLVGGASQHDTWDPKPEANSSIRSPFAPIRTTAPGMMLSELFPNLARHAHQFALVRSVHHDQKPMHEVGFQQLHTGRLFGSGPEWPGLAAVVGELCECEARTKRQRERAEINTGVNVSHGQGHGWLKPASHTVTSLAHVLPALRAGAKVITWNQFSTVFDAPSWDCHADGGSLACDLNDIRNTVAPALDAGLSRLLQELQLEGRLHRTLVIATGEFGRTPKFNCNGGRDHWPGVWTALVAGGGVRGGQVLGSSDADGATPKNRPVQAVDLHATILHALGFNTTTTIPGPRGTPVRIMTGTPIRELF
jgi:uncharacterized protein (DUF1501 family)